MAVADVVKALRQYQDDLLEKSKGKDPDFVGFANDPTQRDANNLLLNDDFALLLAVIFDQSMRAEAAWRYPYQLLKNSQLGHLNPLKLSKIHLVDLDNIFEQTRPGLHYWRVASSRTIRAAHMVIDKYHGDASMIWRKASPSVIEERLRAFDGIGQKKSSMLVNILYRDLNRIILTPEQLSEINVSNDVQIQRVFIRTGLVTRLTERQIVAAGRTHSPDYPGKLDLPAWVIGRESCDNQAPKCDECVLSKCCPKLIHYQT